MGGELRALRKRMMRQATGNPRAFAEAKKRAAKERVELGLCHHEDDERLFATQEEANGPQVPVRCPDCQKERLIVAIVLANSNGKVGDAEAAAMKGFLR